MRFFRPCFIARRLYDDAIFRIITEEKLLCLTFDDGPDPDSTPELLEILDKHFVKALFFCDGKAAEKYPGLIGLMISKGHIIGNHGYNHYDGWATPVNKYVEDVSSAASFTSSVLFRPPYGRLRINQYRRLKETFKIIFWDLMPYDFDKSFGCEKTLKILKNKTRPGSVIVLHDSSNSCANKILDEFIGFTLGAGYSFGLPWLAQK